MNTLKITLTCKKEISLSLHGLCGAGEFYGGSTKVEGLTGLSYHLLLLAHLAQQLFDLVLCLRCIVYFPRILHLFIVLVGLISYVSCCCDIIRLLRRVVLQSVLGMTIAC